MSKSKRRKGKAMQRNLVAKHARQFNKASIQKDKKRSAKAGYQKHKGEV
ncbi:hypothetical protein N9937_00095 [bacterium]|nr:hypothetical protein [bacterium]